MSIHLFGIRHHGPGCARSLVGALEALQPDCILIEGPPEADELIHHVGDPGLCPPVALLVYAPAEPRRAVMYPFAQFSPEWQAMRFAQAHGTTVRFCDLPQAYRLADAEAGSGNDAKPAAPAADDALHADPLRWLAGAAGFGDTETWWDHLVEQRGDSLELFTAIAEMMAVVRNEIAPPPNALESRREAYMRSMIRQAEKQGHQRIAVVCGAYHVPALRQMPSAKSDAALLKGLPKIKLAATWTPWSYGRLTFRSGYGAGVDAPGWYHHLWQRPEQAGLYWLTDVATLLRKHDLDASPAHTIEALRLADTLAAMRERSRAGLGELQDAVRSVYCYDSELPLRLIASELLINERLGQVPASVPTLPLVQDVQALQKRLRLPVRADTSELALDLREAAHLEKSVLLHRLALLDIAWGRRLSVHGKSGTFHERWQLAWEPEFAVKLIEASLWGSTVTDAATACALDRAASAETLPQLTALVEEILLADLQGAIDGVMQRMQEVSATTPDLGYMLAALPPLVNVMRYGSVRGTDTHALSSILDGLVTRACIALPAGVRALADEAATALMQALVSADQAIRLAQRPDYQASWLTALEQAASNDATHALLAGRCTRALNEQVHWSMEQTASQLALRCSHALPPLSSAHWLEGFLHGSGSLLIHNEQLRRLIDTWLTGLPADTFVELLPLLRRTFGSFAAPEKRQLSERASQGGGTKAQVSASMPLDETRARRILPALRLLLGSTPAQEHA